MYWPRMRTLDPTISKCYKLEIPFGTYAHGSQDKALHGNQMTLEILSLTRVVDYKKLNKSSMKKKIVNSSFP